MSDDLQNQILALQKENTKLSRQLVRLQATIERNTAAAASNASVITMQAIEKRKQEHYLRSMLTNSPNFLLLLDNELRITYCTQKTLDIAGIDQYVKINRKHYREVFKLLAEPEWIENTEQKINKALAEGVLLDLEAVLNVPGQGPRYYDIQFAPQSVAESEFGGSIIFMHDITEIRQVQKEAEEARRRAELANLAKSTFLANMSHEIRTPMNAIVGMTSIGLTTDGTEKKNYCLTKIDEASKHLLNIINDILDMSKIEANKFELSYSNVYFTKILQRVTTFITLRVDERFQEFSSHVDNRIPAMVETDEQRLAQVLTNLLSNAAKFTPEYGKISLNATLVAEEGDDCTIRFEVSDTGIGITPEQKGRLFQSFEQADSGTARKFGGTGLGLSISKRIVEMMGGRIWLESEPDKGSTFIFEINAKRKSAENTNELRCDLTLENMRLLVVDDSQETLEYFVDMMGKMNIDCDIADSGAKACELIEKNGQYDVCFIDWYMPGMNGIELTKKIKQRSDSNQTVIVMISGQEWNTIEPEARGVGVDSFLQKPIFPSTVIDCLNRYVKVPDGVDKKKVMLQNIFEGKCILLVEDVRINREIVKAQLAETKVEIDCAVNGVEAVKMFSDAPDKYDIIFMDMQMPEMDGLEATRAIRASDIPTAKTVPIVAMTANVFREDIENCLEAGMNDHIGKPIDLMIVVAKIKQYTARV